MSSYLQSSKFTNKEIKKAIKKLTAMVLQSPEPPFPMESEQYLVELPSWIREMKEVIDDHFCSTSIVYENTIITRFTSGAEFRISFEKQVRKANS